MQSHLLAARTNLSDSHVAPAGPGDGQHPALVPETSAGSQIAFVLAQNKELQAEVEQLRAERNRLADMQHRIMELLATRSPDKIVHDLRNVLNERELLKALIDQL